MEWMVWEFILLVFEQKHYSPFGQNFTYYVLFNGALNNQMNIMFPSSAEEGCSYKYSCGMVQYEATL